LITCFAFFSTIDVREYMALMGVSFGGTIDDKLEGKADLIPPPNPKKLSLSVLLYVHRSLLPAVR
jgi:hypothetical protein